MSKNSRRSSCQKDSDGTDAAHPWRYRTRSGRAISTCHFRGRPHKAASLANSAAAEALDAVLELRGYVEELQAIELPKGFGRD